MKCLGCDGLAVTNDIWCKLCLAAINRTIAKERK